MINLEKSSIQSDENNKEGATTLSSTSDSLQMKKIKGEFPRIRARITSKHTLFAFTTFTDGRWVSIKLTGKPHYFAPKYDTIHRLNQTGFGTLLKNAVPNILAWRCISVDYIHFCEGCESKKCKNVGCARTRTRERGGKDENVEHDKILLWNEIHSSPSIR